jgi:hypothetical protein
MRDGAQKPGELSVSAGLSQIFRGERR